jgi:tetratricopeptide (TPR) repeat protein
MSDLSPFFRKHRMLIIGSTAFLVVVVVAILAFSRGWFSPRNPLLDSPKLALETLDAKSLYFNGRAKSWLLSQRPELLKAEDRDPDSERSRSFPQAVENPKKLFRVLVRKYTFDALLLIGDPSEYKPLLDHLVETKDWTLRYVDHTSMIFRRDSGRAWQVEDFAKVRERFAHSSARDRAEVLAQTAVKLLAAKQVEAGKTLLDEASDLAPREPHVANALAMYYIGRGEWAQASQQVERALSAKSDFLPALATKTQLLYGMKRFSEAYDISSKLIAKVPDDPNLLFYHAKIAHEAHAYQTEVAALGKLIKQAEADGRPIGGYQLYLGQAYTAMGDAQRAIDAFMLALDDPDLPVDQRGFARENITRIKKRTGL